MSATDGLFAPVIAVQKGRNAVHLAQQNGTTVDGGLMSVVPLFTDTLCGRSIGWSGWSEVQEAATCARCERLNAGIEWTRDAYIAEAHVAALAEDAARDSAALAARLAADPQEQRAIQEQREWAEDKQRARDRDAALALNPAYRRTHATRVAWSGVSLPSEQTDRETRRRCQGEGHPLRPGADACYCAGGPDATVPEPTSAPDVTPDTPWQEGDPAPRLIIADYGRLGWGEDAGPRHIVAEVRGVDSDHGYDVRTLQQDDRDGTGTQGAADTLCGVIAYGVMYWPGQGPAVDCPDCQDVRAAYPAEYVAPLPEETDAERDIREWAERNDVPAETVRERFRRNAETSVTVRTEWGTEATESLPDASAVTAEREGRTMRLRADEIRPGDVVPVGGVVGTVTGGGPVPIAVQVTSAMLGTDAAFHLSNLYRDTVVDISAQEALAEAYDALPLRDRSRLVSLAWQAFEEETLGQARVLRAHKVHYNVVTADPYSNAGELFADLRRTGTIRVLSTRVTGGHPILPDHVNEAFRFVHDILGHAATGRGFDRHGEEAAFRAHSVLYSPLARLALATETRGQNASMLRAGGVFPPERIAILPEEWREIGALRPRGVILTERARVDAARDHAAQGLGRWGA